MSVVINTRTWLNETAEKWELSRMEKYRGLSSGRKKQSSCEFISYHGIYLQHYIDTENGIASSWNKGDMFQWFDIWSDSKLLFRINK